MKLAALVAILDVIVGEILFIKHSNITIEAELLNEDPHVAQILQNKNKKGSLSIFVHFIKECALAAILDVVLGTILYV